MKRSKQYLGALAVALTLLSCGLPSRSRGALADHSGQLQEAAYDESSDADSRMGSDNVAATCDNATAETDVTDGNASYTVPDSLLPATKKGVPEQLLRRKAYVCSFNTTTLMPNWVAWKLTAAHTDGEVQRKSVKFHPDEDIPAAYRVTTYDYMQSGYDRGHMCPAADNRWDRQAMDECFLMTNMCPQDHGLNAGDWNEMEMQCRRWAKEYGEVYIVSGPILYRGKHATIGKEHRVTVPEAFFKVVLCLKGTPKAIGFIYRNTDGNRPKGDYVNSIDQVERITGFDFFHGLNKSVQDKVEKEADLGLW